MKLLCFVVDVLKEARHFIGNIQKCQVTAGFYPIFEHYHCGASESRLHLK